MKFSKLNICMLLVSLTLICRESIAVEIDPECKRICEVEKTECRSVADQKVDNAEHPLIGEPSTAKKSSDWPAERREKLNKSDGFKNQKAEMHAACYSQFKQCEKKCVPQSMLK